MLKTVFLQDEREPSGGVMLLGGFDGMHLGHRKLLEKAKSYGLPVGVMTIVGGKDTESVFTFAEREKIFRRLGIDFVFELPFSEIKALSADEFLSLLFDNFSPQAFVCGEDFRFGKGAAGTPAMLKESTRVRVEVETLVEVNGEKVSTTAIKRALAVGEVEKANTLLGEEFFLLGEVVAGRKIGRTLGFPTANIVYPKEKYALKKGVYETRVQLDGAVYKGITNYGARPTFSDEQVCTETYLDGFTGDLYGKTLEVRFVRFLREIRKFDGVERLKEQLQKDIRRVREND